jgi:putative transposase
VLLQRGQHRQKVSLAAALWLSPRRETIGLFFETLPNAYFDNFRSAAFLKMLLEHLGEQQRVIVIWDGGTMHKGEPIKALLAESADRLSLERFPPYAPMLNPIEPLWSWLKYGRLCNFAARDALHLNEIAITELRAIENDQERLRNFFHASDLPLPRAILF